MQSAPCFATGRGEILEPLTLDLSSYSFLLVHPQIRIDTAWAFSKIKPGIPKYNLKQSISKSVQHWIYTIFNDFEIPVFEVHPQLRFIKDRLYEAGAIYASMTGSGSTIYGIFDKSAVPEIAFDNADQTLIR
jgi:4-diphosphocytidyl-2-C-methyl-D-erythritol kinase